MYEGVVKNGTFSHSASFITARDSHVKNFALLKRLGCGNEYIASVAHVIKDEAGGDLMVSEPLLPLDYIFKKEQASFVPFGSKSEWWEKIEMLFTSILTDVAHALIYLDSKGYYCGDLLNGIYVDMEGRGKILPSFQYTKEKGYKIDIKQLVSKMKFLICLPFTDAVIDVTYGLPYELRTFLDFASPEKTNCLPIHAIYNHPYFWSAQEKITFMLDLSIYNKEYSFLETALQQSVGYSNAFKEDWSSSINHGIFKKIFERPLDENSNLQIAKYDSYRQVEIIRYVRAAYNHVNEYTEAGREYTQVNVEAHLRRFFPSMYVDFYEGLCNVAWRYRNDIDSRKKIVISFEKWSSLYFAKQTNSITNDKVNEIFKLMSAGPLTDDQTGN